ncbi:cytohesin-interacting protein-like [Mytilus galloprovincialis]|uniref:cytohesin-interacting protein-like n=1 Tax=Mytilus galloprovincialis TaxID=29158 RepID=UPI003F7B7A61
MTWVNTMEMVSHLSWKQDKKKIPMIPSSSSIGADLHCLEPERSIKSHPNDNTKRRTLFLKKINNSWGFTLQTYGIKHKKTNEIEIMTYVDYIEITGPAYMAGMRKGDVILSVNGESVDRNSHKELVRVIRGCGDSMRMVVMFEDCCKKVELHDRIFRLKEILAHKKLALKELEQQEKEIIDDYCQSKGITRFQRIRQSMISTVSTNSWDRYSLIQSPQLLETFPVPHVPSTSKSLFEGDYSSSIGEDLDDSYISYVDSDADSGMCICCPNTDEHIALKNLKDTDSKSNKSLKMNNTGKSKKLNSGENEEVVYLRSNSIPFVYSDYVYINKEDESTEL